MTLAAFYPFPRCFSRIVALLFYLSLVSRMDAQTPSEEVSTLLTFKQTVLRNDQSWASEAVHEPRGYWSSWKENDTNPCSWVGIACSTNFTVQAIDLSGWGISSLLLSINILSSLQYLEQLDLSDNGLGTTVGTTEGNGFIPEGIGSFTGLTRLDLSRNNFVGRIPDTINNCSNLRYLSLEQNNLGGEIPSLARLVNLQVLSLAHNQLTGPFPKQLQELTSLISIDLSNNMLSGTIPSLPKLTNLLDLNIDNNRFTEFEDPQDPGSINLEHFFISRNQLEGSIPPGLTSLLNLAVLNMSSNRLSGNIPPGLARQLNHSFWLDLSQNQLDGEIPDDLLQPHQIDVIVSLNLSHNLLTGEIPIKVGVQDQYFFNVFDLSHNRLSGPIPNLTNGANQFYYFCLQNNSLSGDVADLLYETGSFSSTRELRLDNNIFTGDLTRMAGRWGKFEFKLKVLDLSNNNLQMQGTKEYPDPLRSTLEAFMGGTIREFRVQGNNFSGTSLPAGYFSAKGNNSALEVLDLSNSHLQGHISGAVFNSTWLPALKYLNFSNNEATGNIPPTIFMLENLTVLDVSHNNLSGVLPTIPRSSNLYDSSFYDGNQLCGDPLPNCPGPIDPGRTGVEWWVLLIIALSAVMLSVFSCSIVFWRWRVYSKKHQQDADLIKTLLERESASLMAFRDLRKATDNFAASAQIGVGGFGTVYLGKLNDGTTVAIKRSKREGKESDKQQFLNEVRILSYVNHRHLVKLLGCCMENKIALLVFEYIPNGTLQEHLQGKKGDMPLSWKQRVRIAVQTTDALNYLHSAASYPIFHRDVKSSNILLSNDLTAKVSDFGISKLVPLEATHASTVAVQGTMGYLDPEYYSTFQLTAKSDVYSLGMVLLELISSKPAIDFSRGEDETSLVNFATPLINSGDLGRLLDPVLQETYNDPAGRESILNVGRLALRCLNMRSKLRPSMNDVCRELSLELDGTPDFMVQIDHDSNLDVGRPRFSSNYNHTSSSSGTSVDHIQLTNSFSAR